MDIFKHMAHQANSFGSKSSVLSCLIWALGTLLMALTGSIVFNADMFIKIGIFLLIVLIIIVMVISFLFCLFTGKTDVLRSEKYNISKMMIEKQSSSDSVTGINYTDNIVNSKNESNKIEDEMS